MPAGVHKGKRVVLTLSQETYDQWASLAEIMDMPVATAIRSILEVTTPSLTKSAVDTVTALENGKDFDDVMGRAMWEVMKIINNLQKEDAK